MIVGIQKHLPLLLTLSEMILAAQEHLFFDNFLHTLKSELNASRATEHV